MKVMIADDNRLMLEGFRRALDRVEDIDIVGVTHTGAQVLSLIERRGPQVLALDLAMRTPEGVSCLDLFAALSRSERRGAVRDGDARGDSLGAEPRRTGVRHEERQPAGYPVRMRQAYEGTVYHMLGSTTGPDDDLRSAGLTEREITMLKALARGLSNKAISQELWVTEQTVKFHLGNLYRKLGVQNRLAAASYAHSHGVVSG